MLPNNPRKRKNLLMWGLYSLLLLVIILLQTVFFGQFTLAGVHLLLLPIFISAVAVVTSAEAGGIFALASGLLWALSGGSDGGVTMVCLTVSGILAGFLCDAVLTRHLLSAVLMALLSLMVTCGGVLLLRLYLSPGGIFALRMSLRQIILTLPLSPPMYWVCKLIRKVGPDNG